MNTRRLLFVLTVANLSFLGHGSSASDSFVDAQVLVKQIGHPALTTMAIGRTSANETISAILHHEDLDLNSKKWRILLVADSASGSHSIGRALRWFYQADADHHFREQFTISALPQISPSKSAAGQHTFPPTGKYYQSNSAVAQQYAWRWIGMHAPDLVVYVHPGDANREWYYPHPTVASLVGQSKSTRLPGPPDQLVVALVKQAPCATGTIPAMRVTTQGKGQAGFMSKLLECLAQVSERTASPARQELQARIARSPRDIAEQLSMTYGNQLKHVTYIPTLALVGRIRLGELGGNATHRQAVNRLVAPYLSGQSRTTAANGSSIAGHLIFTELAQRTAAGQARERLITLARPAAEVGFTPTGKLREAMPHHQEMSDAVFMSGPLLAEMGQLTGEARYFDMAMRHIRFIRQRCQRADGIYRHSPLDSTAWGRGNGFPALGLALSLSHWPEDRKDHEKLLTMFQEHMDALQKYQDQTGCWHQIIDRPDSYREFTCTCMITFAMARGVARGWLEHDLYDPIIRRAWPAIQVRIAANGNLVDVCTGTGKQQSETAYYHRTAILGRDDRGGAMALLASTELAEYLATPR